MHSGSTDGTLRCLWRSGSVMLREFGGYCLSRNVGKLARFVLAPAQLIDAPALAR